MSVVTNPAISSIYTKGNILPIVSWRGKTIQQVVSRIERNAQTFYPTSKGTRNYFLPNPLKIYRREITNLDPSSCDVGISVTIREMEIPSGTIPKWKSTTPLVNLSINENLQNKMQNPFYNVCGNDGKTPITNIQANALRRIRTSGVIKKSIFGNSNQYLYKRSKTYEQNQFHYKSQSASPKTQTCDARNLINVYKPNNAEYAQQGGVSASSRTTRLHYDTVSTNKERYGDLLYYGANYNGYNIKLKKGKGFQMTSSPHFPNNKTPLNTNASKNVVCNILEGVVHL